jgi:uncharacterized protein YkwD
MQGHRQGVVVALLLLAGGTVGPAARGGSGGDLVFCVDEINRYRKLAKLPLLRRSADLEAYAAAGAAIDAKARQAHHHFSTTTYPHPFREMGENEIPWWPAQQYGTTRDVIRAGTKSMWDEGPGGGHYQNLIGSYTQVGCGIHMANGEVTVVSDFLLPR